MCIEQECSQGTLKVKAMYSISPYKTITCMVYTYVGHHVLYTRDIHCVSFQCDVTWWYAMVCYYERIVYYKYTTQDIWICWGKKKSTFQAMQQLTSSIVCHSTVYTI